METHVEKKREQSVSARYGSAPPTSIFFFFFFPLARHKEIHALTYMQISLPKSSYRVTVYPTQKDVEQTPPEFKRSTAACISLHVSERTTTKQWCFTRTKQKGSRARDH